MTTLVEPAPVEVVPERKTADKVTIVAYSGDLEAVWATMIIASAGAASAMETTIFFTFWGLFPLVRDNRRITGTTVMQRMLSLMNRGGASHLKTSKFNFLGAGPAMMRHLAKQYKVASPQELIQLSQELGVRMIPCQMSMDMMGIKREDLIDGLEEPAGAAYMLEQARGASTFFI